MPIHREDFGVPWHKTDFGRRRRAAYMAEKRAEWLAAGLCTDCGRAREWPTLRCGWCREGNALRAIGKWDRKRMAKADLRVSGAVR